MQAEGNGARPGLSREAQGDATATKGKANDAAKVHDAFFKAVQARDMAAVMRIMFTSDITPSYVDVRGDNVLNMLARQRPSHRLQGTAGLRDQRSFERETAKLEPLLTALLRHEAPPCVHHEGAEGMTPLLAAVKRDDVVLTSSLLRLSDAQIHRKDRHGRSPWMYAIASQRWDILLQMLRLRKFVPADKARDEIIRRAAKAGRADVICAVIDVCVFGAAPQEHSALSGDTVLMATIRARGDERTVLAVLESGGAGTINRQNSRGDTALSLAIAAQPRFLCTSPRGGSRRATERDGQALESQSSPLAHSDEWTAGKERLDVVLTLLTASPAADVNAKHSGNMTPIMLAAKQGRPDIIEVLLDATPPANLLAVNDSGETVLMLMLSASYDFRHVDAYQLERVTMRVLRASGAVINHQDRDGHTSLHRAVTLHTHSCSPAGRTQTFPTGRKFVRQLVAAGADASIVDSRHDTALLVALQCGPTLAACGCTRRHHEVSESGTDMDMVASLIAAQDADCLASTNSDGRDAISIAAEYWPDALPPLLDAGADLEAHKAAGVMSELVMLAASSGSCIAIAKLLGHRDGWDINDRDELGRTALLHAVMGWAAATERAFSRYAQVVQLLLDAGADVNVADAHGSTPLMLAGLGNDARLQRALLAARPPPDCMATDAEGSTALHYLFKQRCFKRYRFDKYVDRYARSRALAPRFTRFPQAPDPARVQHLLEAAGPALAVCRDAWGRSPLMLAASLPQSWVQRPMNTACVNCLLQSVCTAHRAGVSGCDLTPAIMAAVREKNLEVLQALLSAEVELDLRQKDTRGKTALLLAAERQCTRAVEMLVQRGDPGVELRNEAGDTALLIAARSGFAAMTEVLLGPTAQANPDESDISGRSALLLAIGGGHHEVVLLLLKAGAMASLEGLADRHTCLT